MYLRKIRRGRGNSAPHERSKQMGQPGPEVTLRGDGSWWKWDGLKWIGPFTTEEEARRADAKR